MYSYPLFSKGERGRRGRSFPRNSAVPEAQRRAGETRDNLPVLELEPGWFVPPIDLPKLLLRMFGLTLEEARALSRGADIRRLFPVAV